MKFSARSRSSSRILRIRSYSLRELSSRRSSVRTGVHFFPKGIGSRFFVLSTNSGTLLILYGRLLPETGPYRKDTVSLPSDIESCGMILHGSCPSGTSFSEKVSSICSPLKKRIPVESVASPISYVVRNSSSRSTAAASCAQSVVCFLISRSP